MKILRLNVPNLIFITATAISVILMLVMGIFWYNARKSSMQSNYENFRKHLFESSENMVMEMVNSALRLINTGRDKINTHTNSDLKDYTELLAANTTFLTESTGNTDSRELRRYITGYNSSNSDKFPFIIIPQKPELIVPSALSAAGGYYKQNPQELQNLVKLIKTEEDGIFLSSLNPDENRPQPFIISKCYARYLPEADIIIGTAFIDAEIEASAQDEILSYVSDIGLIEDDYIFVLTPDGRMIAHDNPRQIGRNLYNFTDKNGIRVIQSLIETAQKNPDGGFVEYVWRRPSTNIISDKIGFAKEWKPKGWIIGSGLYLANFEVILANQRAILQQELNKDFRTMLIILFGIIAIITIVSSLVAYKIKANITSFIESLNASVKSHCSLNKRSNLLAEFDEISYNTNLIIADFIQKEMELKDLTLNLEEKVAIRTSELQTKTTQLEESTRLANSANEAKSNFLANMSHEIRTPMNIILGMQQLLLDSEISRTQENYLLKANQAAKSLLSIIDDILDFSKIEAGRLNIERIETNIEDILNNVLSFLSFEAAKKDIELILDYDINIPEVLIGDPLRLRQVISNLCNNAIKFSSGGSVLISVKLSTIRNSQVSVDFEVRDSGIGIPPEKQKDLFKPFIQADNSITREFGGTGLGLIICKQLIELQGGKISLHSIPKIGTTISFQLPFVLPADAVRSQIPDIEKHFDEKLLIIDKNHTVLSILKKYAENFGYTTDTATTLPQACKLLEKPGNISALYNTILINSAVTENHGIEVYQYLRKHYELSQTSFIYMTKQPTLEIIRSIKELGFNHILNKPVSPRKFLHVLENPQDTTIVSASIFDSSLQTGKKWPEASILVVEDNRINQEIIENLLRKAGCRITLARNGEAAIALVKNQHFDLVFMDIQMPVMDGLEATRQIRLFDAATPIVAMTAHAMTEDYSRSIDAGMNDHITKPIKLDRLYQTLNKFIDSAAPVNDMTDNGTDTAQETPSKSSEKPGDIWKKLSALTHLDLPAAVENTGGDKDILIDIYQNYIQIGGEILAQLVAAYQHDNMDEVLRIAHTLKGSCGTIGENRIFQTARDLEMLLKQNLSADITNEYDALISELDSFIAALTDIFTPPQNTD